MKKGFYDAHGVFHPQYVRLNETASGRCGLFSMGMMAWPLDRADYEFLLSSPEAFVQYATRLGFSVA